MFSLGWWVGCSHRIRKSRGLEVKIKDVDKTKPEEDRGEPGNVVCVHRDHGEG